MKKLFMSCLFLFVLFTTKNAFAWNVSLVDFAFTTDILEIIDEDYQIEFLSVISYNSAWSVRVGQYRHLEDSDDEYEENKKHWELGFRWRYFPMERAPNLLFFGIGFDNRPEDNTITSTGEIGLNICLKPIIVGLVGFYGYELNWKDSDENRSVKGIELRAGFCF